MRRTWRSNRLIYFLVILIFCAGLIVLSSLGFTRIVEDLIAVPLNFITLTINRSATDLQQAINEPGDIESLRARSAELEEQLALIQAEVIQLREIASDYNRLASLLDYTSSTRNQSFVTADVIGVDTQSSLRSIIINRGTRDGIAVGMPVVTQLGLVGRIHDVSANFSRVQLITDQNSNVSGRLQTSRAEGSIQGRGLLTGTLDMLFLPVGAVITEGDLVVTSGLGGNYPPDIVIGQVTSVRNLEFELSQSAQVRSLIDFNALEFVLVMTSFQPADISVFEDGT